MQGSDHFVHFTELTKRNPYYGAMGTGAVKAHVGDVKCSLEPMKEKARETAVYLAEENGTMRVRRVEIRGENVAHIF